MRWVVVVIALALLGVGASASTGAPDSEQAIARFREKVISTTRLGTYAGATEVWHSRVYLQRQDKRVGDGYVACIYIEPNAERQCTGTYELPRGSIRVGGIVHGEGLGRAAQDSSQAGRGSGFTLLITSADGIYLAAGGSGRGRVQYTPIGLGQRFLTFYFE